MGWVYAVPAHVLPHTSTISTGETRESGKGGTEKPHVKPPPEEVRGKTVTLRSEQGCMGGRRGV
jgi:hypothetical protein